MRPLVGTSPPKQEFGRTIANVVTVGPLGPFFAAGKDFSLGKPRNRLLQRVPGALRKSGVLHDGTSSSRRNVVAKTIHDHRITQFTRRGHIRWLMSVFLTRDHCLLRRLESPRSIDGLYVGPSPCPIFSGTINHLQEISESWTNQGQHNRRLIRDVEPLAPQWRNDPRHPANKNPSKVAH